MFEKEFQEWFERNKKWLYSSDHMQAAYYAWRAGVQQQQAAQQSVHLTGGIQRDFQALSTGEQNPAPEELPVPPASR